LLRARDGTRSTLPLPFSLHHAVCARPDRRADTSPCHRLWWTIRRDGWSITFVRSTGRVLYSDNQC
jgi:hypothetical protein